MTDEFLVEKERRRQLNRQKLQELHETQEAYEQIRRTTTITDAEAAVRARNNLTGTAEISVETKPNQGDDLARKISAVKESVKDQYRSEGRGRSTGKKRNKNPLPSSEFTDYGDDWATTYCNILGAVAVLLALLLVYVMWFTNLIR